MEQARVWLIEIVGAFYLSVFGFYVGLYQACMLAGRKHPLLELGHVSPVSTKFGVCYYSRGESFLLDNFIYLTGASFIVLAVLISSVKYVRRYNLPSQQFVSEPDISQGSRVRFTVFVLLFVVTLGFVCWG
ncbi:MAG TPA: hypothetical protein VK522_04700 [Pseudolabrys sp.]|nr:hypothetical protein [Pseudolabrys sp.]